MMTMNKNNYIKTLIYQHIFSLIVFYLHIKLDLYFILLINKLLLYCHIACNIQPLTLVYLRLFILFSRILPMNTHSVENG
jgi:hypothetical protein